jgi:CheY-like chemotaxis protein/HPt (histidine-containing phosphotransfer) domain-containing protein
MVLTAFMEDAPARAERIERALADLRAASVERMRESVQILDFEAHALRGAAATVGLDDIQAQAAAVEEAAARWNPDSAATREAVVEAGGDLLERLRGVTPANEDTGLARPSESSASGSSRPLVLHVEDNVSNLKLVERILERRPEIELREARTGAEALELASTLRPTLVLLDLRLPDMSGEDVLRRLRDDVDTREIPVVVISAEARPIEADRVLAAGADDFLVKPIDVRVFLELVDGILAKASRSG